ncbi:unnamed protein product [Phytophthora fragariaefolia]|uniref:Unnamed protein product n=1 Tax=Phytophthora fragariaefolia TaxID=1490495 RepID=A0A9W6X8X4_9STRA|nr:unnamed protein product [Phytophthora fragariaefolia]
MAKEGQSGGEQAKTRKKRSKSRRKELQSRTRRGPASPGNNSNDKQLEDQQQHTKSPKSRRRSEAEKRNEVEKQRKLRHDTSDRDAQTNNRFLRAISGQAGKADAPEKQKPDNDNNNGDDDAADTTTSLLKKQETQLTGKSTEGIIVTPAASYSDWLHKHAASLPTASMWAAQLRQQEEAGVFVEEEKKRFHRLKHSTVDRLEERLHRELFTSAQRQNKSRSTSSESNISSVREKNWDGLIEGLLLLDPPAADATEQIILLGDESTSNNTPLQLEGDLRDHIDPSKLTKTSSIAMLELFVDRVVLDDHPAFVLADRLAAQLRALYTAYSRMLQQQPWQLSLQRLDEFFSFSTEKLADSDVFKRKGTRVNISSRQVLQEINELLTNLEALTLLHQQIISKGNELRDVCTHTGFTNCLQVKRRQRAQHIDLSRVEAVLDLLIADENNQQDESGEDNANALHKISGKISERLAVISATSNQALQTVLQLESVENENHLKASFWSPKFYVVLRVNGKIACTTTTQPWSRGEVRFSEKVCLTLSFFPSSVCAEVYECRRLLPDVLISTNAIPIIVPGQHVAKHAPTRSRNSLLDSWGDDDTHQLIPAASLTPSYEWYQFSCTAGIPRAQWHQSFHNSPLFAHSSRATQGRLHLQASWVQGVTNLGSHQSIGETLYVPPKRPETAGGHQRSPSPVKLVGKAPKILNHLSQYLCDSQLSSERDFLRLVDPEELPLDPNDPENVAVRRLQVFYMEQQQEAKAVRLGQREVFRTSDVSGPLAGSGRGLTKRNRLLRLRDREYMSRHGTSFCEAVASHDRGKVEPPRWVPQLTVFDEPLPLLEHELLADERLLRLLRPELHAFDRRLLTEEAERADASMVERHRLRQLLKLQDFRERVRQTQIVSNYNTASSNQEARAGRSKPWSDIVQEKPLPLFPRTFEFPTVGALFTPRRRLRPRPKLPAATSSTQTSSAHWPTACTLYVQVQKATNVPVRVKPPQNIAEAEEIATTGRRRRDTLQRTKKSPRMMSPSDNLSEEVTETPRGGLALEYESNIFVQISFQGKTRQTSCATITGTVHKGERDNGAHPVWIETAALPFHPPQDDWSPEGIESTQDIIRFNIFDQVTRPASTYPAEEDRQEKEERLGAQTRALHRENCFLGSLEVPFLTLYHAGRLEGSLRCEMPVEHLGYANLKVGSTRRATSSIGQSSTGPPSAASSDGEGLSPRQRSKRNGRTQKQSLTSPRQQLSPEASTVEDEKDGDDDTDELGVKQAAREATFLKLTLLLDPILPLANEARDHKEKETWNTGDGNAQGQHFLAYAQRWTASVKKSAPASAVPRRNYNPFVRNLSHGATFLPRFLRAQSPPPELQTATLLTFVRYVSLIPFLDDWLAFDGDKDVWSTTQEFLSMGAGDHEEHAVLLANYFMWYDRRSRRNREDHKPPRTYLVLGYAVPEGNIVLVLRRGVLWNASTGVGYAVSDPHCPLRDVSLVVSSKNVFANIQPLTSTLGVSVGNSHELDWDIERNTKCWQPFFTTRDITLPPSVQRRDLKYAVTPPEFVDQVERELREALKLAVRRWRSTHFATNFNEAASLQLREHLVVLEREANGPRDRPAIQSEPSQVNPRSMNRLKQKLKMKLALPMRRVHPGSAVLVELQRTREVCGLPLHASFTDIPRVLEMVENTVRPRPATVLWYYICCNVELTHSYSRLLVARTFIITSDQASSSPLPCT